MQPASPAPPQGGPSRPPFRPSSSRPTFLTGVDIEERQPRSCVTTPREANKIHKSWVYANDCLEGFVRDVLGLLTPPRLRVLQTEFEQRGGRVTLVQFACVMESVLEPFIPARGPSAAGSTWRYPEEELELVHLLSELFRQMDSNGNGLLEWEEFTSFLIDAHVALEASPPPDQQPGGQWPSLQVRQYLAGPDAVKPRKEKQQVIAAASTPAALAGHAVTPRVAVGKVFYFPEGPDVVAAVEMDGQRVTLYDPSRSLATVATLRTPGNRMHYMAHVKPLGLYAVATSQPSLCFFSDATRRLRSVVALRTNPICLAWTDAKHSLLCGGQADGRLFGCRLGPSSQPSVEWVDLLPAVKRPHREPIVETTWLRYVEQLATAGMDGLVKTWNLQEGKLVRSFDGHGGRGVRALGKSEDARLLLSGGFDTDALVWSPSVKEPIARLQAHHHAVIKVQAIGGTSEALTADASGLIKLWDLRTYRCLQSFGKDWRSDAITDVVSLAPRHRRIVTASPTTLQTFDLHASLALQQDHMNVGAYYNSSSHSVVLSTSRDVRIYDAMQGRLLKVHPQPDSVEVTAVCLDGRQRKFFLGDTGGHVRAFDYVNGSMMKSMHNGPSPPNTRHHRPLPSPDPAAGTTTTRVTHLLYAHEHQTLLVVHSDRSLHIHDESQQYVGPLLRRLPDLHEATVTAIAHHGDSIATGAADGQVKVWDYHTGRMEAVCVGHASVVVAIEFLAPYPAMLTAEASGAVIIWGLRPSLFAFQRLYVWRPCDVGNGPAKVALYRLGLEDRRHRHRDKELVKDHEFRRQTQRFERYRYQTAGVSMVEGGVSKNRRAQEKSIAEFAVHFGGGGGGQHANTLTHLQLLVADERGWVSRWNLLPLMELLGRHYLYRRADVKRDRGVGADLAAAEVSSPTGLTAKEVNPRSPAGGDIRNSQTPTRSPDTRRRQRALSPMAGGGPRSPSGDDGGRKQPPEHGVAAIISSPKQSQVLTSPKSALRSPSLRFKSPKAVMLSPGGGNIRSPSSASPVRSPQRREPVRSPRTVTCGHVDDDSTEMRLARRAVAAHRLHAMATWQAHDEPIVSLQVILDPLSLLTSAADGRIRAWTLKGGPLGELHKDRAVEWELPINVKALQQRRRAEAQLVLDTAEVERTLAAERDSQAAAVAFAAAGQSPHPASAPCLTATGQLDDSFTTTTTMAPLSLTRRILTLEKRVEAERERRLDNQLPGSGSKVSLIQAQARRRLWSMMRKVRNYALFLRAAQESPASLNHCMRKAGVLSPRESEEQKKDRQGRMNARLQQDVPAGAEEEVGGPAGGKEDALSAALAISPLRQSTRLSRTASSSTRGTWRGGKATLQRSAAAAGSFLGASTDLPGAGMSMSLSASPLTTSSRMKRSAVVLGGGDAEVGEEGPIPWELPAVVFKDQLTVTRVPGMTAAMNTLRPHEAEQLLIGQAAPVEGPGHAGKDERSRWPFVDPHATSRLGSTPTPRAPTTPRPRPSPRTTKAGLAGSIRSLGQALSATNSGRAAADYKPAVCFAPPTTTLQSTMVAPTVQLSSPPASAMKGGSPPQPPGEKPSAADAEAGEVERRPVKLHLEDERQVLSRLLSPSPPQPRGAGGGGDDDPLVAALELARKGEGFRRAQQEGGATDTLSLRLTRRPDMCKSMAGASSASSSSASLASSAPSLAAGQEGQGSRPPSPSPAFTTTFLDMEEDDEADGADRVLTGVAEGGDEEGEDPAPSRSRRWGIESVLTVEKPALPAGGSTLSRLEASRQQAVVASPPLTPPRTAAVVDRMEAGLTTLQVARLRRQQQQEDPAAFRPWGTSDGHMEDDDDDDQATRPGIDVTEQLREIEERLRAGQGPGAS